VLHAPPISPPWFNRPDRFIYFALLVHIKWNWWWPFRSKRIPVIPLDKMLWNKWLCRRSNDQPNVGLFRTKCRHHWCNAL
jgi:hypothetical protein